jgi:hypothetical protein
LLNENSEFQALGQRVTGRLWLPASKRAITDCLAQFLSDNVVNRVGFEYQPYMNKIPKCFNIHHEEFLRHPEAKNLLKQTHNVAIAAIEQSPLVRKLQDEIFPNVLKSVQAVVAGKMAPGPERDGIISAIGGKKLNLECHTPDYETNNAFYRHGGTEGESIGICVGMLTRCSSLFCLVHTLAHEVGHSLGPCAFGVLKPKSLVPGTVMKSYPFAETVRCLQGEKSLQLPKLGSSNNICDHRHLSEYIADTVASEAMPVYFEKYGIQVRTADQFRQGYANAFHNHCSPGDEPDKGSASHPPDSSRITLLMNSSGVREQMGCSRAPKWSCPLK